MRALLAITSLLVVPAAACAAEPFALKDGQRVVFLGDSNTWAGTFIAYLDAYLCTRFPGQRFELINLGLPSETVSGLSEPDHPYPRPNVHDRVTRALELTRPDVVVVCYGMNDGIYHPFVEERFRAYQDGVRKLIETIEKAGARVMLMSPAPFDPTPVKDKLLPPGAEKYSWLRPYQKYDEDVLARYSDWLVTLRAKGYTVIDAHTALLKHVAAMRAETPGYRVSADGIHPNADGHLVIALEILKEWKAPTAVVDVAIDLAANPPTASGAKLVATGRGAATAALALPLPMPADQRWTPRVKDVTRFDARVNRYPFKVSGLTGPQAIRLGDTPAGKPVPTRGEDLAKGIDLAPMLKPTSDKHAAEVWKLIEEKHRLLGPAWVTHVGHKRPDTPKGILFDEAKTKAVALDETVRRLCKPRDVRLEIGPP